MNYKKIYDLIVEKAKNNTTIVGYTEKHHIVPRCIGGDNSKDNLVYLSFREHFLCHRLLCKIYPDNKKLIYAFSMMIVFNPAQKARIQFLSSRHFEIVKKTIQPYVGSWNIGRTPWNKGLCGSPYKQRYKKGGLAPPNGTGTKWINNGFEDKKLAANIDIPTGWVRGRLKMKNNNPMKIKEIAAKCISRRINKEIKNESKENS